MTMRVLVFAFAMLASFTTLAAASNHYKITFSNQSKKATYFIFTDQQSGAKPLILKQGETSPSITVQETAHIYLGTPNGVKRLVTSQVYPLPTVVITEQLEGFSSKDRPVENGTDVLVTFDKKGRIKLKNQGKSRF